MLWCCCNVHQFSRESAKEIKSREPPTSNDVFDAAAEQKQIQHVAQQMEKAGMDKHRRQIRVPTRVRRRQPKMLFNPIRRLLSVTERKRQPHEIHQHVEPNQ